ncbi:ferric reductase like transmembrane component [Astrocystis sublimbata]|nr:ferric reductase like transmembrane component [Astrocystis sublimbata]
MGWPWEFVDLDDAQKLARRHTLDRYGLIAQLSALVPVALFLLYRLVAWSVARLSGAGRGSYAAVPEIPDVPPNSPTLKRERLSPVGSWSASARKVAWWFGDDVVFLGWNWGPRDQIIAAVAWSGWLLGLCVVGTGKDYLHLTRRFGIVGVSQFPVQYLMSLKSLNPFALAFNSSHEEVNRWHRALGRIIYVFVGLHATFYFNFYYQNSLLSEKLTSLVPILGVILMGAFHLLYWTSLSIVRQYSYRIFFITHLIVALAVPPLIYIHADHASPYVWEALLVFIVDIAKRKFDTTVAEVKVELIPDTDLVKIVGSIPPGNVERFAKNPGTHIYLSVPAASRPNKNPIAAAHLVFEFSFNPFSIAAVNENDGELTLIARKHNGPMTRALAGLADGTNTSPKVKLLFDGPHGCAKRFPNLASSEFDRILLVAGGVGATFTLPLYRWILAENPAARVQMVWTVRNTGDASWPDSKGAESILDDENVQLYLTGNARKDAGGSFELSSDSEDVELASLNESQTQAARVSIYREKRPDLKKIVDGVFRQGSEDSVAILVCGPEAMARELRAHVGDWVGKGRSVWWHNESFTW